MELAAAQAQVRRLQLERERWMYAEVVEWGRQVRAAADLGLTPMMGSNILARAKRRAGEGTSRK